MSKTKRLPGVTPYTPLPRALVEAMNKIIEERKFCMFYFYDGRVFLLKDHYKHSNYAFAPKVLIGHADKPKGMHLINNCYLYLTEPIQ